MVIIAIIAAIALVCWIVRERDTERALLSAMKAEQAKQAARQSRHEKAQAAAWEKQRKDDARRDAKLEKHDEEIRKLQQTARRLSAKLEDLELRITDLESVKELVYKQFLAADHVGDDARTEKALRKLISIDNQLSAARDARQKTLDGIENANRKIAA